MGERALTTHADDPSIDEDNQTFLGLTKMDNNFMVVLHCCCSGDVIIMGNVGGESIPQGHDH